MIVYLCDILVTDEDEQKHLQSLEEVLKWLRDSVFVKNYHQGVKWLPGVIDKKTEPVSFVVRLEDGQQRRCHQDQIKMRTVEVGFEPTSETEVPPASSEEQPPTTLSEPEPVVVTEPVHRTYPSHTRTAVQRYDPSW